MKFIYILIVLSGSISCGLGWFSSLYAQDLAVDSSSVMILDTRHQIPGVKIIPRSVWGADESLKYNDHAVYQAILDRQAKEASSIARLQKQGGPKRETIRKQREKKQKAYDYMQEHFPKERFPLQSISHDMGNKLFWPYSYQQKTKFIIHHTVTDTTTLQNSQDVYKYLQKTQKFHALTRGWGDIGYNYLIGPHGEIYEGRAGGEYVIGAHATWNNFESIGIALIGNFEQEEVNPIQLEALINLITQLSIKYHINPHDQKTYHTESKTEPYIQDLQYPGIIGHTHVGKTQCPGKNLLPYMDYIRQEVLIRMGIIKHHATRLLTIPSSGMDLIFTGILTTTPTQCIINSDRLVLDQCRYEGNNLILKLTPKDLAGYSRKLYQNVVTLGYSDGVQTQISLRYKLLPSPAQELQALRNDYLKTYPAYQKTKKQMSKIQGKIQESEIKSLSSKQVAVLLHNASLIGKHSIICDQGCILTDSYGAVEYMTGVLTISKTDTQIELERSKKAKKTYLSLQIAAQGKRINLTNTNNVRSYQGTLTLIPGQLKSTSGALLKTILIINTLTFRDYMYGIAEEDKSQHNEKLNTMAILAKNYALFYLDKNNTHNSIIVGQGYDFIDDPRFFQKYAGYDFQKQHPLWVQAVDQTRNQWVLYDQSIAILPYYHCNAGFTWSASDAFGRVDTAYLTSLLDADGICKSGKFEGHGVGLSGVGAQKKALSGWKYADIIKFYYPHTEIITITT